MTATGAQAWLVGRTYEMRRERMRGGAHASFTIQFVEGGRLMMTIQGQQLEEAWQPSTWNPLAVILGGRAMPAAEIILGPRFPGCDPNDIWEPSPPMGAPPLIGTWQRNCKADTNAIATKATKLEMIVDRSGSMQPLHSATVQGLNAFLVEQRALPNACAMTMRLVAFDDQIETCWEEGTPLSDTSLTVHPAMVQPRGTTALLDAIGGTLINTPLAPARVVCIVTDGCENASRRCTRSQVNDLITARKEAGWTFIFLAANQDAIAVGGTLGIDAGTCATFSATSAGIAAGFGSASASSCRGAMFGSSAANFSSAERAACLSGQSK